MQVQVKRFLAPFIISLLLLASIIYGVSPDAQAAPPAAPTPVANILTADRAQFFRFQPTTGITQDTNTSGFDLLGYNSLDISITTDHGTVNTTTFTIQYSNDNTNWDDGAAFLSNNAADATDITRLPIFGRYARVNQNVTNANLVTFTILAVAR